MAKNRRHQSAAVRFAPAIKVLLVCSFIVGAGVGYVCQKEQLVDLGRRKVRLEERIRGLRAQSGQCQGRLLRLQSTSALEAKVTELKLGLQRAQADQIVHLAEPPVTLAVQQAEENSIRNTPLRRGVNRDSLVER